MASTPRKPDVVATLEDLQKEQLSMAPVFTTGPWKPAAFINSWAHYEAAGGFMPCAYRKGRDGRVTIRGLVKHPGATGVSTIFNLPVGFRPSKNLIFVEWGAVAGFEPQAARVNVASGGEVGVELPSAETSYLTLNLSFYPD